MTRTPNINGNVAVAGEMVGFQKSGAHGFAKQTTTPILTVRPKDGSGFLAMQNASHALLHQTKRFQITLGRLAAMAAT